MLPLYRVVQYTPTYYPTYSRIPYSEADAAASRSNRSAKTGSGSSDEEVTSHGCTPLDDEDTYSHALVSIVRDCHWISQGTEYPCVRVARLCLSIGLIVLTIGVQVALLWEVKRLVSALAVSSIRGVYSDFEQKMYNVTKLVHGDYRGVSGFRPEKFSTFSSDDKEVVCQIPLAHPFYLMLVLFIWGLTTLTEIRRSCTLAIRFLINTPLVDSFYNDVEPLEDNPVALVVKGVTLPIKLAVVLLVILPRMVMALTLLWLGSRWLVAVPDLAELLLNAIALEFVLLLKDLIYNVVVPHRSKVDIQQTYFEPLARREHISCINMSGTLVNIFVAIGWACLYPLQFQQVLFGYNFDVREVCADWLARLSSV